ncbi:hypothetical protein Golob_000009, partial [Gossypium lobatum]|nr:hypothetical protein [Gossypium lobatum]
MGSCIVNNMEKVNGDGLLLALIKNATVEQVVENKLKNYRKRPINLEDLHLNTTSHFNPTFEGSVELGISLNPNLLDPSKHTTMVFKDNHGDNTTISLEGGDLGIFDIGGSITKMVEAVGFSGGILIGWKDLVKVEVVYSHPQFGELESVLHHEKLLWKQKAKYDWLIMEDHDIIIFGKADKNQAKLLKGILKDFYNFSRRRMNTRKSNVFFSIGVSEDPRKTFSDILGFNRLSVFGKIETLFIFQGITWSTEDVIKTSFSWAKQYILALKVNVSNRKVPIVVVPKLGNWIHLNSHEAVKEESGFVMIGGVLRDRYGGWIVGYNRSVGICSVLDFELWGILEGLTIAMDRGFDRVLIVSDSHEAVQAIQGVLQRDFIKEVDSLAKMDVDNK